MLKKNATVGIYTLGCKVNQYESQAMAEALITGGIDVCSPSERCDGYIINTCTVTAESDRKARQFIRRAINKNPSAFIVVTGCLAETAAESLTGISGVDAVVGNARKMESVRVMLELFGGGEKNSQPTVYREALEGADFEQMSITRFDRTRAYVKIEDGCENRCTYCIIPSARGKVRSKPFDEVMSEVCGLVKGGCREVVLTGIETASYGKDLEGVTLGGLLSAVDKIEGIGRVRLGSLDPSLIKEELVDRIAELSSLAPHFHLSLQSGSSRILALMKRKYNARQAMEAILLLRSRLPRVQFTTDVIVGFPTETEEDFLKTYEFLKNARFLMVHIFPYSKRAGTPAAEMDGQVPEDVKKERLHKLEALTSDIRREILTEEIEKYPVRKVLFETYADGMAYGHTPEFLEVGVRSSVSLHGEVREVILKSHDGNICYGDLT